MRWPHLCFMLLLRFSASDWILSVCGRANKGDDDAAAAAAAHPQMLFAPDDLFVVTDNHFFALRWARDCGSAPQRAWCVICSNRRKKRGSEGRGRRRGSTCFWGSPSSPHENMTTQPNVGDELSAFASEKGPIASTLCILRWQMATCDSPFVLLFLCASSEEHASRFLNLRKRPTPRWVRGGSDDEE